MLRVRIIWGVMVHCTIPKQELLHCTNAPGARPIKQLRRSTESQAACSLVCLLHAASRPVKPAGSSPKLGAAAGLIRCAPFSAELTSPYAGADAGVATAALIRASASGESQSAGPTRRPI